MDFYKLGYLHNRSFQMQKFISGIIIGFLLGTLITVTYAAMSGNINARRYQQYVETADGKTALLVTVVE